MTYTETVRMTADRRLALNNFMAEGMATAGMCKRVVIPVCDVRFPNGVDAMVSVKYHEGALRLVTDVFRPLTTGKMHKKIKVEPLNEVQNISFSIKDNQDCSGNYIIKFKVG